MKRLRYNLIRYGWRVPWALVSLLILFLFLLAVFMTRGKKYALELGHAITDEMTDIQKSHAYRAKMYRFKARDLERDTEVKHD